MLAQHRPLCNRLRLCALHVNSPGIVPNSNTQADHSSTRMTRMTRKRQPQLRLRHDPPQQLFLCSTLLPVIGACVAIDATQVLVCNFHGSRPQHETAHTSKTRKLASVPSDGRSCHFPPSAASYSLPCGRRTLKHFWSTVTRVCHQNAC